jgi:hypothetical protein
MAWLTSVVTPEATPTPSPPRPSAARDLRSEPGDRLAARIAELSRGAGPDVPAASEAPETETDKTRASMWRSKHT